MPQSRLFVSSVSRRDLARRRPGRHIPVGPILMLLALIAFGLGAFVAGHGGF